MAKILVCCLHPYYIPPIAPDTVQKRPRTYLYGRFSRMPAKMESAGGVALTARLPYT